MNRQASPVATANVEAVASTSSPESRNRPSCAAMDPRDNPQKEADVLATNAKLSFFDHEPQVSALRRTTGEIRACWMTTRSTMPTGGPCRRRFVWSNSFLIGGMTVADAVVLRNDTTLTAGVHDGRAYPCHAPLESSYMTASKMCARR